MPIYSAALPYAWEEKAKIIALGGKYQEKNEGSRGRRGEELRPDSSGFRASSENGPCFGPPAAILGAADAEKPDLSSTKGRGGRISE